MSPKVLFFTGAPELNSLDWEKPDLYESFSAPFQRFAHLSDLPGPIPSLSASSIQPAWRLLPLKQQHLATGHSQLHTWHKGPQDVSFFTASDVNSFLEEPSQGSIGASFPSTEPVEDVLSQFYEQSYAIHEDILSSQLQSSSAIGSFYSDTSLVTESSLNSPLQSRDIPSAGHLTNLKDIPHANYIQSIQPQTVTVNLVVGIISNPPARTIKTRRGPDVELVEILVGDDTKSGFGVNFWSSPSQHVEGDFQSVLANLRPQDVVLVKNVALSSFRGRVYGQSLRKGMTKCHLLYRDRAGKNDAGGCYRSNDLDSDETGNLQIETTRRVREWVLRFVGVTIETKQKGNGRGDAVLEALPPDTQ